LKFGDRFYYETDNEQLRFTREQLASIKSVLNSRVLCNTVDVDFIQEYSFFTANRDWNRLVRCEHLPSLDLGLWRDRSCEHDPGDVTSMPLPSTSTPSPEPTTTTAWGYRDVNNNIDVILPNQWGDGFPDCYGPRQSPINIETPRTVYSTSLRPLVISRKPSNGNTNVNLETWKMYNNGFSVYLEPQDQKFSFLMPPDNVEYKLLNIQLHWRGSEHTVNGWKFAAELHLVHQSTVDSNKLAVIGFFLDVS
jgi:hypothetical protein